MKLTVIKVDTGPESGETEYLPTNERSFTGQQHAQLYRRRWAIELYFRPSVRASKDGIAPWR